MAALVLVYAIFVLTWLATRLAFGERWWWMALLDTFPAWVFLPVPLMLLLAALDRRPAVVLAALVPAVLWLGIFGGRVLAHPLLRLAGRPAHAESNEQRVRVLAFNVLYTNRDVNAIAAAIRSSDADLVALPELTPAIDAGLAQQLGDRYPYRVCGTLPGASFGTGIYSRWPLVDLGSLRTGLGLRSAAADVQTPYGIVRFVALHPRATLADVRSYRAFSESITSCFREREAQLTAVCQSVDQWANRPLILAGDFNMTEFSDAYRCLGERLHDAYQETGFGMGHTWPNVTDSDTPMHGLPVFLPLTRIDYVFHSDHWQAVEARLLDGNTGSDHRPVLVDLRPTEH